MLFGSQIKLTERHLNRRRILLNDGSFSDADNKITDNSMENQEDAVKDTDDSEADSAKSAAAFQWHQQTESVHTDELDGTALITGRSQTSIKSTGNKRKTPLCVLTPVLDPEASWCAKVNYFRTRRRIPLFCENWKKRMMMTQRHFSRISDASFDCEPTNVQSIDYDDMESPECSEDETEMMEQNNETPDEFKGFTMDVFGNFPTSIKIPIITGNNGRNSNQLNRRYSLTPRPPSPTTRQVIHITMNTKRDENT